MTEPSRSFGSRTALKLALVYSSTSALAFITLVALAATAETSFPVSGSQAAATKPSSGMLPINGADPLSDQRKQTDRGESFGAPRGSDSNVATARQQVGPSDMADPHHDKSNTGHRDARWVNVRQDDSLSPPTVINKQNEFVVGAGSNVSLACQARGSPPLTFVWFQDEKNLTTTLSNATEQPASTKLLEERRYEIAEELGPNTTTSLLYLYDLQISDTSLFLCWVENGAGYSHANFSLTVNNSPPAHLSGNINGGNPWWKSLGLSASEAQLSIVSILFVLLLVAAILFIFMFKYNGRSRKNSKSNDLKQSGNGPRMANIKQIAGANANGKFAVSGDLHQRSMLAESDGYDDSGDESSTDSSSSCQKNTGLDYDGFIEHMRTGIINIDYHSMSPVGQFNNSFKNQPNVDVSAVPQQQLRNLNQKMLQPSYLSKPHQQPFLGANQHAMHHFPSASNTSSVPPYYGSGNGSASMATTTSDLSPGSGSGNTNFANNNGPPSTNCDPQHQFNEMNGPHTNTTTTSYTSDYQSGYGVGTHLDELQDATNSMPPMYYETGGVDGHIAGYHPGLYTSANGQLMMPAGSMMHAQNSNISQGVLQDRMLAQRLLANQQHQQQQQQRQSLHLDQKFQIL